MGGDIETALETVNVPSTSSIQPESSAGSILQLDAWWATRGRQFICRSPRGHLQGARALCPQDRRHGAGDEHASRPRGS